MNNSVFGKTMEILRKRISAKLFNNAKDYVKCIGKPSFVSQKIFSENFVAIHEIKPVLRLNKPIYVGFSILDLSKYLMYEFHYKYIKSKFDAKLLFTDTDSLVYEIKTEDVFEDLYQDKNLYDFIDYPLHSKFFDLFNKKVVGKMKDEFKEIIISEFVGLKSKIYSLIGVDDKEVFVTSLSSTPINEYIFDFNPTNSLICGGVNNKIKHKEFFYVLFKKKVIRLNMKRIQSKLHRIGTYDVCKISLSCFDDKRYILDDGVNSLAYFNKDIKD